MMFISDLAAVVPCIPTRQDKMVCVIVDVGELRADAFLSRIFFIMQGWGVHPLK